jgi:hypothetical protein
MREQLHRDCLTLVMAVFGLLFYAALAAVLLTFAAQ